jgi:hypothetical protein
MGSSEPGSVAGAARWAPSHRSTNESLARRRCTYTRAMRDLPDPGLAPRRS